MIRITPAKTDCPSCKGRYAYCFLHDKLKIEAEDAVRTKAPIQWCRK